MNNRRVAGAVVFPAFRIHYVQTKSTGDCRPGGEAFWCVWCILWFSNNQCNPYYYHSFSCFLTTIFSMRFSVARSAFTTAAAAGAVCIILNQRLVSSLNPQDVVGPAARLFSVFSVFCGLKFRALSCLSWLLKTFGCGQRPLQAFRSS